MNFHRLRHCAPGVLLAGLMISGLAAPAARADEAIDLTPKIHGAIRARFEYGTRTGEERFEARNARLTVAGMVAPQIDYFAQADLCDRGTMKILDAWGRLKIADGLRIRAGQFRLPMGTDCFRGPANYIFSNRSFLVKQMNNVRGVGAELQYQKQLSAGNSIGVSAGAFNPTSITDQTKWVKSLAYAGKVSYTHGGWKVEAGTETLIPDSVRVNLTGASLSWHNDRLLVEGEYLYKHYVNRAHKAAHGWQVFADYGFPVKWGVFNRFSVQGRYDGITAHSSGKRNKEGKLYTDFDPSNRATIGGTLTYAYKAVHCDVRLSYEKFFYHENHRTGNPDAEDKVCAELVVRF